MQNVYQCQNPQAFDELKHLIENNPRCFKTLLDNKNGKRQNSVHLLEWMNDVLPHEARHLRIKEKCWWILHGLTEFPKCMTCEKTIKSDQFMSIVRGYRTYCCPQCVFKSDTYRMHLSESYVRAVQKDPDFYRKRGQKNKQTRLKNSGSYFSEEALEKRRKTISQDPDFWKRRDKKCKETKVKNGHSPNWTNPEKNVQTRLANHSGKWEDETTVLHRKQNSLKKYGVDDPNRSGTVKTHKAQAFERKYGNGVTCWFQTPKSREYMKNVNEQRKAKEYATKKKNGTFNTSKQEENAYHMLHFLHPHLMRQHKSEQYPFACDFFDPDTSTWYECNFSWTHGGHWFNEDDPNDIARIEFMRSKQSKYYDNAIETWTVRDVKKRRCAEDNYLNYIVFWNEKEVRRYVLDELQRIYERV